MSNRRFFATVGMALMAAAEVFAAAAESEPEDDAGQGEAAPPPRTSRRRAAADEPADEPAPRRRAAAPPADEPEDEAPPRRRAKAGLDYETEVRPHIVKLSKDHGREAAAEILEQFKNPATGKPCTKGQELDEADYDEALKLVLDEQKRLDKKAREAADD